MENLVKEIIYPKDIIRVTEKGVESKKGKEALTNDIKCSGEEHPT